MADQRSTATSLLRAIAGTLGLSVLAGFLVTMLVAPAIAVTGVTATSTVGIFNELPEYIQLDSASQQSTIAVRNADGTLTTVATIYRQNRQEVSLDLVDDDLECAALAGEDRRFYEHAGVDLPSLAPAVVGQITGTQRFRCLDPDDAIPHRGQRDLARPRGRHVAQPGDYDREDQLLPADLSLSVRGLPSGS